MPRQKIGSTSSVLRNFSALIQGRPFRCVSATLLSTQRRQTSRLLGVGGELPNRSRPPATRRSVVGSHGRAGPFGSEARALVIKRACSAPRNQNGWKSMRSACAWNAAENLVVLGWEERCCVGGTASLPGRETTERARGNSLVGNGHDFDSQPAQNFVSATSRASRRALPTGADSLA